MGLDSKPPQAPLLSQRVSFRVQIPCWGTRAKGSRVKKVHLYRFRLRISKRFIQFWGSVLGLSPTFCAPNMEISAPPRNLSRPQKRLENHQEKKRADENRRAAPRLDSTEETDGGRRSRQRPEGTHRPSPTYRTTTTTTTTTSSAAAADLKKKIW